MSRALSVPCPTCDAPAGSPCEYGGVAAPPHDARGPHAERTMSALSPYPDVRESIGDDEAERGSIVAAKGRCLVRLRAEFETIVANPIAGGPSRLFSLLAEYTEAARLLAEFEKAVARAAKRHADPGERAARDDAMKRLGLCPVSEQRRLAGFSCTSNPCFGCPNA